MSVYDVVPVSFEDYRRSARRRVPRFLFDYADGGANDERTHHDNHADFDAWRLRQRVLRDVSGVDTRTTLLGQDAAMPLALAPVGMAGMYARRGEVQANRAAAAAGVPFTSSTMGVCGIDEINAATERPAWFQLYMLRDRDYVLELLARARAAGTRTLVFTVDLPVPGMRLRDHRNGMIGGGWRGRLSKAVQIATSPLWAWDVGVRGTPHGLGNLAGRVADANDLQAYAAFAGSQFDPTVTWDDIRWLRDHWDGPLLIKGVMEADDARAAVDCGAEGVVVSNHGGRQLDGVASALRKLPDVVAAVDGAAEVYMDGGVRSGIDLVKAVALGARGVLVGRAWLYALASGGERAVHAWLTLMQREVATALALTGAPRITDLDASVLEATRADH
ncbi:MAG TPA: L-lactate dehydrogenase [Pseudomonadales bacterium]|nr:L-lactate dehydrogenase [Pseudomonadales bacterium]